MKEEIEQHLADRYDELRAAGLSEPDAGRAVASEREEFAERARRRHLFAGAGGDVRYALRTLRVVCVICCCSSRLTISCCFSPTSSSCSAGSRSHRWTYRPGRHT